jgi:hypothetical protein
MHNSKKPSAAVNVSNRLILKYDPEKFAMNFVTSENQF